MKIELFDYYIYIDYSKDLIGYTIIEKEKIPNLLKKVIKLRHFKDSRHKRTYLAKIKRIFEKDSLYSLIYKYKINFVRGALLIFNEISKFIMGKKENRIFISVDDKQYTSFIRLFKELFSLKNIFIIKENKLKKNSNGYRLSLIIDNLLNIDRKSKQAIPS